MTLTIDHAVTTRQDSGAMTDLTPPDPEVRDRSSGRPASRPSTRRRSSPSTRLSTGPSGVPCCAARVSTPR